MKVLHVYKTCYPTTYGGVEQMIHQLALQLPAQGVEPAVLAVQPRDAAAIELPYTVYTARRDWQIASMDLSLAAIGLFGRLARQADIIHYHFPWPYMDLLHFIQRLRGVKKPSLVTYHSDIVRQKNLLKLYRPLQRLFLGSVDAIVATSPAYAASSAVLQRYRDKVTVVPIGIAPVTAADPQRTAFYTERFGRFFLFVGALRQYKGLNYLLQALQGTPYPLVIMGDGPERTALEAEVRQLGLAPQVHFLGALSDAEKQALLAACYAFVFPSQLRSEAFGIALLEATQAGKPMISTELGTGTSYINQNGETGIVVPPANPAALRAALQQLWDNPALAESYGRSAAARYAALFTAEKMAIGYADLYRRLLA